MFIGFIGVLNRAPMHCCEASASQITIRLIIVEIPDWTAESRKNSPQHFFCLGKNWTVHTGKFFLNFFTSNQLWIVITLFLLHWNNKRDPLWYSKQGSVLVDDCRPPPHLNKSRLVPYFFCHMFQTILRRKKIQTEGKLSARSYCV